MPKPNNKGASSSAFTAGQELAGGYVLKSILTWGAGPGVTWAARDEKAGRDLALHILPGSLDAAALAEYRALVRKNRTVVHPHILPINELIETPDWSALRMDFAGGETLAALRDKKENGRFEPAEIKPWIFQLCETLRDARRARLPALDISPANLIVSPEGGLLVAAPGASGARDEGVGALIRELLGGPPPEEWEPEIAARLAGAPAPISSVKREAPPARKQQPVTEAEVVVPTETAAEPAAAAEEKRAGCKFPALAVLAAIILVGIVATALYCANNTPTPTRAAAPSPTPTPTSAIVNAPSPTPKPATPAPVKTPSPAPSTPTPTPAPSVSPSATPAPSASPEAPIRVMRAEPVAPVQTPSAPQSSAPPPSANMRVNSLGMRFVPVGKVLFTIWATRVEDFAQFAKATQFSSSAWKDPGFEQAPDHPVVYVSWEDAMNFCKWLTQKEQKAGALNPHQYYRLPTDLEWSKAVGLPEESGATPEARDMDVPSIFPWGTQWPPPRMAGNYTGEETSSDVAIKGYNDGFVYTSPVTAFPPNKLGLYDMGGNVSQWCMDSWNSEQRAKVLRGGSWYNGALRLSLLSSCRVHAPPETSTDNWGFRCVIANDTKPH